MSRRASFRKPSALSWLLVGSVSVGLQGVGRAQQAAPAAPATPAAVNVPAAPAASPPPFDPNAHLDSSSRARADISQGDSFDFGGGRGGSSTLRGNPAAGAVDSSVREPAGTYVVRPGDTLSRISENVYGKPWMWPKLWSQNPQIQNPHWIYPGDQVQLSTGSGPLMRGSGQALTLGAAGAGGGAAAGKPDRPHSVYLSERGYLDDPSNEIAGEIVGAMQPIQMMSQGDVVYVAIKPGQQMQAGQVVQVFREVREPPKIEGARQPPGKIVSIKGAVRLDYVNADKHIARGILIESRDTVERGDRVGATPLEFLVVPPKAASKNLVARVLTSLRPAVYLGRDDVVFIDRGSEDGLAAGNRLFVIRRGDTWRRTLDATSLQARTRLELESDGLSFDVAPQHGNEQDFPEEIVGELRILKTQRFSSYALVVASRSELVPGDRAVARVGF